MSALYVETSSLLTWLLGEPRAQEVRQAVDAASAVATSVLTVLEAERALVRLLLAGTLSEADSQRSRGVLRQLLAGWYTMEISRSVRTRAGERFPVEPVRSLDAIHLATALEFSAIHSDLAVLCFDRRVADNVTPLGLTLAVT